MKILLVIYAIVYIYSIWQWYYTPQFIDIHSTDCKIFLIPSDKSQFSLLFFFIVLYFFLSFFSLVCDLIGTCINHYYRSKQRVYFLINFSSYHKCVIFFFFHFFSSFLSAFFRCNILDRRLRNTYK